MSNPAVLSSSLDPYVFDLLDQARQQHWYGLEELTGAKVILTYDESVTVLRDPRFRQPGVDLLHWQGVTSGALHDWYASIMLNADGETHSRLRSLVNRAFTPAAIKALRPALADVADELLDALPATGDGVDLMHAYCDPFAALMICELLGIPRSHRDQVAWASSLLGLVFLFPLPDGKLGEIEDALAWLYGYVDERLAERRAERGTDLLSRLVDAEEQGDRLSDHELRVMAANLVLAGYDTTMSTMGCLLVTLLDDPGAAERLRDEPDVAHAAIEELLRHTPALAGGYRVANEDVELRGETIAAGEFVMVFGMSANRDPAHYDDPATLDFDRPVQSPSLTFGVGMHYCLGASLARAALEESLPRILQRLPGLRSAQPVTWRDSGFRCPASLVVSWD